MDDTADATCAVGTCSLSADTVMAGSSCSNVLSAGVLAVMSDMRNSVFIAAAKVRKKVRSL